MKKYLEKFNKLKPIQKTEFVFASLITLALVIAIPVRAWFSYANKIETMAKIKEPNMLDIRAGNADPAVNFDLRDVNIEEMKDGKSHYCVFSVITEDDSIAYDLQLAHTTNIPFEYNIWKAERLSDKPNDESGEYVEYHPIDDDTTITYYKKGEKVVLSALNTDTESESSYGRPVAEKDGEYYDKTYDGSDTPQTYAVPLYLKTETPIAHEAQSGADYFILELKWNGDPNDNTNFSQWNKAENNKETDIIYITASRSSG